MDTGLITLLYSKNPPKEISQLFKEIEMEKFEGHIVSPIISEAFYHICNINGKVAAESAIASFLYKYPIKLMIKIIPNKHFILDSEFFRPCFLLI